MPKRTTKIMYAQKYEGAAASQKVKAAQWTGEIAWKDADHPSSKASASGNHWTATDIDYDKPYFELKDGDYYCNLCGAYANEGHVTSEKHKKRADNPEWYGFGTESAKVTGDYDKPWFEQRSDGNWFCKLCNAVATDGHLASSKHQTRSQSPEWYGYPTGASAGSIATGTPSTASTSSSDPPQPWVCHICKDSGDPYYYNPVTHVTQWEFPMSAASCKMQLPMGSSSATVPKQYVKPWFENKQGDWYCNLCGAWATDGHISSEKHTKRAANPSWYGFDQGQANQQAKAALSPSPSYAPSEQLPSPWKAHWSKRDEQFYYHNSETNVTQWEHPLEVSC